MKKRTKILTAVFVAVPFLAFLFSRWKSNSEPRYQGVLLGRLLDQAALSSNLPGGSLLAYATDDGGGQVALTPFQTAQRAVISLNGNAVSYLVWILEFEPTPMQIPYAKLHSSLPPWLQDLAAPPRNTPQRRALAAALLKETGTNAIFAMPLLLKLAEEDIFFPTRQNALQSAIVIARQYRTADHELWKTVLSSDAVRALVLVENPNTPLEDLVAKIQHTNSCIRLRTAQVLGTRGTKAFDAIPALKKLAKDPNPRIQSAAAMALERIRVILDPPARPSQPFPGPPRP